MENSSNNKFDNSEFTINGKIKYFSPVYEFFKCKRTFLSIYLVCNAESIGIKIELRRGVIFLNNDTSFYINFISVKINLRFSSI